MSWGFAVAKTPVVGFADAAAQAYREYAAGLADNDVQLDPAAVGAIDKAIAAAAVIVGSGVVGTGTVTASLSGHANPEHTPTPGWANDFVTISVYCADEYQQPAPETAPEPTAVTS